MCHRDAVFYSIAHLTQQHQIKVGNIVPLGRVVDCGAFAISHIYQLVEGGNRHVYIIKQAAQPFAEAMPMKARLICWLRAHNY